MRDPQRRAAALRDSSVLPSARGIRSAMMSKNNGEKLREAMMRRLMAGLLAFCVAGWCAAAAAQEWPVRPVRIIIPLGPGGGGDVFTRLIAEELQKALGQPFVVENRPGGGLNIGTRACAEAAPDGYTLFVLSGEPVVYNQFTFKNLPFNPEKDFEPVANLFINANALAVNASLGVKTIPELVAHARSKTRAR